MLYAESHMLSIFQKIENRRIHNYSNYDHQVQLYTCKKVYQYILCNFINIRFFSLAINNSLDIEVRKQM